MEINKSIILYGILAICVIVIVVLFLVNQNLASKNDQALNDNQANTITLQSKISSLQSDIVALQTQNERYQQFILTNRSYHAAWQINVDTSRPNMTRIAYDNDVVTLYYADGTNSTLSVPASNG
ncbi:MAG TPA: hypothetical protein VGJ92_03805 [Methanocella sp.]